MPVDGDTPIGAPVLRPTRRDRLSIWIAGHEWVVPIVRLAAGLAVATVVALVIGGDLPWDKVLAFVVVVVLGDRLVERESERGDMLLGAREFADPVHGPPTKASDNRHYRPHM
jgi:hypothetical protein